MTGVAIVDRDTQLQDETLTDFAVSNQSRNEKSLFGKVIQNTAEGDFTDLGAFRESTPDYAYVAGNGGTGAANDDPAVVPGSRLTLNIVRRARTKGALTRLVEEFRASGLSYDYECAPLTISETTAKLAHEVINNMPFFVATPRIAPDEDGGMSMVWDTVSGRHMLLIDENQLHFLKNAGTERAEYFENIPRQWYRFPDRVRNVIENR